MSCQPTPWSACSLDYATSHSLATLRKVLSILDRTMKSHDCKHTSGRGNISTSCPCAPISSSSPGAGRKRQLRRAICRKEALGPPPRASPSVVTARSRRRRLLGLAAAHAQRLCHALGALLEGSTRQAAQIVQRHSMWKIVAPWLRTAADTCRGGKAARLVAAACTACARGALAAAALALIISPIAVTGLMLAGSPPSMLCAVPAGVGWRGVAAVRGRRQRRLAAPSRPGRLAGVSGICTSTRKRAFGRGRSGHSLPS